MIGARFIVNLRHDISTEHFPEYFYQHIIIMRIERIDRLDDPRLAPYASLTEAQLRNRLSPGEGLSSLKVRK